MVSNQSALIWLPGKQTKGDLKEYIKHGDGLLLTLIVIFIISNNNK